MSDIVNRPKDPNSNLTKLLDGDLCADFLHYAQALNVRVVIVADEIGKEQVACQFRSTEHQAEPENPGAYGLGLLLARAIRDKGTERTMVVLLGLLMPVPQYLELYARTAWYRLVNKVKSCFRRNHS